jgi:hypothetical protein
MKLDWSLLRTTYIVYLLDQRFKTNCTIHSLRRKGQSCQVIIMLKSNWAFKFGLSFVYATLPCIQQYKFRRFLCRSLFLCSALFMFRQLITIYARYHREQDLINWTKPRRSSSQPRKAEKTFSYKNLNVIYFVFHS